MFLLTTTPYSLVPTPCLPKAASLDISIEQ